MVYHFKSCRRKKNTYIPLLIVLKENVVKNIPPAHGPRHFEGVKNEKKKSLPRYPMLRDRAATRSPGKIRKNNTYILLNSSKTKKML